MRIHIVTLATAEQKITRNIIAQSSVKAMQIALRTYPDLDDTAKLRTLTSRPLLKASEVAA